MFDQFYHDSSDQFKLAFLNESLQKYPNLKEDFLAFYHTPADTDLKMTISDPDVFITEIADLVRADFESIDINEPNWENYVPRHSGYIPDYEAMEHMAEDEIESVIGLHMDEVVRYCVEKQFDKAFLFIIGMYQACMEAELDDEYDSLPDGNLSLLSELENQLQSRLSLFTVIQISNDQLYTIASVIFDQFQKNYSNEPKFLTFFEASLFALIQSGAEAALLLEVIQKQNVEDKLPWLLTELHRKSGGIAAWEQSAREVFKKNISVANELLEYYLTENKQEFVKFARELWLDGLFQDEFAKLYFDNLKPAENPDLYKLVTLHLNNRQFSESFYRVLQVLMDKEERISYIETFKWNKSAYVRALCMEENYNEALRFAKQHIDRWNIVDIMTPCLQSEPIIALEILGKKIEELLVNERGRNFYERIARVLKVAADQPTIEHDAKILAAKIYSVNARLSALRDEIKIAGLIKK